MKLPAVNCRVSSRIAAGKPTLRFDKSPTRQSRYGDGALQGIRAKANKMSYCVKGWRLGVKSIKVNEILKDSLG